MPFAQLMAVLPLRDVAYSLRVPSNSNGLKCNKDENETVIAHRSDCGLFLSQNRKEQFTMSEPSNGAWPFQEIPEEEGLDISAIFGDSSAVPQGDPFAPPAAAQSVPSSPTPVAQEITPAVAATLQPTTAPIVNTPAKAPAEAPAENPIAAAFEQKTAENTKKGLLEKPPVFYHKGVKEEIDDPSMTFEELRIRKSDDFTDLEEGKRVSEYAAGSGGRCILSKQREAFRLCGACALCCGKAKRECKTRCDLRAVLRESRLRTGWNPPCLRYAGRCFFPKAFFGARRCACALERFRQGRYDRADRKQPCAVCKRQFAYACPLTGRGYL